MSNQSNNTIEQSQNLSPNENFKSPPGKEYLEHSMELVDHSAMPGKGDGKKLPCTPAIQRLHNTLRQFNVHSPTDQIQSPCSQKLTNAARVRKGHQTHHEIQLQQQRQSKYGQQQNERKVLDFDGNDTMDHEMEEPPKQN